MSKKSVPDNKSTDEGVRKSKAVKPVSPRPSLGRRQKYFYPCRLSLVVEGNLAYALEAAIESHIGGKSDMTGVLTDAIMDYIGKHTLKVLPVDDYGKILKEVVKAKSE
jgi:hypothetical protein